MTTPIYINVFNRLATTKKLAWQCSSIPGCSVVIIDNKSDWPPLIEWYKKECKFDVVFLDENKGHHAPWSVIEEGEAFTEKWGQDKYVVTDCDLDIGKCPADIIEHLKIPFSWNIGVEKSGLSLEIDDLPVWQNGIRQWESQFWKNRFQEDERFFSATIDTTFAMYGISTSHKKAASTRNILCSRSDRPYTAKHVPWYLDAVNLDEENSNYFKTAGRSNSWKPVPGQKFLRH